MNLILVRIDLAQSRNGFIFNTICFTGMILYYFAKTRNKRVLLLIIPILNFIILLTDGRAGALVLFLMSILSIPLLVSKYHSLIKLSLISFVVFLIIASSDITKFYSAAGRFAPLIKSFSPRVSELLVGRKAGGNANMSLDKSWLIRKLMIDKGFEINSKYPLLGIGLGNFTRYFSELKTLPKYIYCIVSII